MAATGSHPPFGGVFGEDFVDAVVVFFGEVEVRFGGVVGGVDVLCVGRGRRWHGGDKRKQLQSTVVKAPHAHVQASANADFVCNTQSISKRETLTND
eukprot:scaffold934_cov191-Alexandrium_tamarense.AAC.3